MMRNGEDILKVVIENTDLPRKFGIYFSASNGGQVTEVV